MPQHNRDARRPFATPPTVTVFRDCLRGGLLPLSLASAMFSFLFFVFFFVYLGQVSALETDRRTDGLADGV
jgi:hypothetical protein